MSMITEAVSTLNFSGGLTTLFWGIVAIFGMVIIGGIFILLSDIWSWNIQVELVWPIGNPYYIVTTDLDGRKVKKKVISVEMQETSGRIYNKLIKQGTWKSYFKIKGARYDRMNHFEPCYFYRRLSRGMMDFRSKGIKLFMHPQKGPIPLAVQNTMLEQASVSMNEVISAYTATEKDIRQKHHNDFWDKYGAAITFTLLIFLVVAAGIFQLKMQELSWEKASQIINTIVTAGKGTQLT